MKTHPMKLLENFLLGPGFFDKGHNESPDRDLEHNQREQGHMLRKLLEEGD